MGEDSKKVFPTEFVVYKSDGSKWNIKYFYRDNTSAEYEIEELPRGLEPNVHYFIGSYETTILANKNN